MKPPVWRPVKRELVMCKTLKHVVTLGLATGAVALAAAPAQAGPRGRYYDRYDHDRHDDHVHVGVDIGRRYEPRYEERRVRVWVEPVYRTVCDRVWVEPVVRTECERVWVPAVYEWREVTRRDFCGRLERVRERVEVEPGHFEERRREVVVRPGHWDTVERQELVCAGHYEWRTERVRVAERDQGWRVGFGFDVR
jgi:hypothetical protein